MSSFGEGYKIEGLDSETCNSIVDWVNGNGAQKSLEGEFTWLLAHCYDGVIWGKFDDNSKNWHLSSNIYPNISPKLGIENLIEARLFGGKNEVLIWRSNDNLSGRIIEDQPVNDNESPLRPEEEIRILFGDRLIERPKEGFTRVGTATGMEQVVPLECEEEDFKGGRWPLRLKVRNYFGKIDESGAISIKATRLVDIYKEES